MSETDATGADLLEGEVSPAPARDGQVDVRDLPGGLRGALENLHPVAITTEQQCQRLSRGAVTDDGDVQRVTHGTPVLMAGKLRRSL